MDIIQKTKQDYNRIAKYFSDTRNYAWPELKQFQKYVKNGQKILDWGCGNGRLFGLMRNKRVRYFGMDISKELLKIARRTFAKEIKEGRAKFFLSGREPKKFPENFFDRAFLIASFHHLPDEKSRRRLLKEIHGALKKNGRIIITVWNLESDWAKSRMDKGWKLTGENDFLIPWKNPEGEIMAERYYHHFSKEKLKELLKDAGFKILKLDFYGATNWTDKKGGRNLVAVAVKL